MDDDALRGRAVLGDEGNDAIGVLRGQRRFVIQVRLRDASQVTEVEAKYREKAFAQLRRLLPRRANGDADVIRAGHELLSLVEREDVDVRVAHLSSSSCR